MVFSRFLGLSIVCITFGWFTPILGAQLGQIVSLEDVETSSSKNLIKRFESPASVSVLTAEKIMQSGVTNIPEALRLMPGLIVREQVHGQYDVSIRGLDNTPRPKFLSESNSRSTLLMIDNRPVFDYFQGGIFWGTLPVSIEDIEKIEVIRGAVASMYGPNAAQGVIHIKTKRQQSQKTQTQLSSSIGTNGLSKQRLAFAGGFDELFWKVGGEFEERDRYESTYFNFFTNEYVPLEALNPSRGISAYPNAERSQKREHLHLSLNNEKEQLVHYDLSVLYQNSIVQKAYISSLNTPLTTNEAESLALNLNIQAYDWNVRLSRHTGNQKIIGYPELEYDFEINQSLLEKNFQGNRWFIRPGIRYDEMRYTGDLLNGEQTLINKSFFTRSELSFSRDLKLIASGSIDKYSFPSDTYYSYEVGATQRLDSSAVVRLGVQRANRSSFMYNSFLDLDVAIGGDVNNRLILKGNKEADLLVIDSVELGWRKAFSFYNAIDIELFYSQAKNYSVPITKPTITDGEQVIQQQLLEGVKTRVHQVGLTLDWKYQSYNWDINTFLTIQTAKVIDQLQTTVVPVLLGDETNKGSPSFYGGAVFNWRLKDKWNLNTSMYLMDDSTTEFIDFEPSYKQPFVALLNLSLRYQLSPQIKAALGARNLSHKKQSQFYYTETISPSVFVKIDATF